MVIEVHGLAPDIAPEFLYMFLRHAGSFEVGNGTKEDLLFLHLLKYNTLRERYIVPGLFTQQGLRSVLGCDQSYISRLLRKNEREGLIYKRVIKVENKRKRQNAYFLTKEGIGFALALVRNISKSNAIE